MLALYCIRNNIILLFYKQDVNLYAEVNGKVMPVTVSSDDAKYQVSLNKNQCELLVHCTSLYTCSWAQLAMSFLKY